MAAQRRLQSQKGRRLIRAAICCLCIAALGAGTVSTLQAQIPKNTPFEEAMKAYKAKKYADAVVLFEDLLAENRQNEQALYYAALCYLQLQQAGTAYEYLKMIPKSQATFLEEYAYWLGRAAHMHHRFEESKTAINTYLTERGSKKLAKEAAALLENINYALELQQKSVPFGIENLQEINSIANETVPISYGDNRRLLFLKKNRSNLSTAKATEEKEGWFSVQKQTDERWERPTRESLPKSNFLALQWIEREKSLLALKEGKLYLIRPVQAEWQIVRELNVQFREASRPLAATLYDQGRKLIFSAFNPETGSLDLFQAELKADGSWSFPYALAEINTSRDEYTPFFAEDSQTLYFSSKGWNTVGGFDIFKTRYDPLKKRWTIPENVGFPINSAGDDYWLQIYGDRGFLASNRSGGTGGDDIYQFFPLSKIVLTGRITGRRGEPLANTPVQFVYQGKNLQTRTDAFGYYRAELPAETDIQLRVWQQGKLQYRENFRIGSEAGSYSKLLQRHFTVQTETATEFVASENSEEIAFVFTLNGNVKDAVHKQPLRATVKLIDLATSKTVKFTSTDANGRFNFYLDKPAKNYFIEVAARGFLSHWQTGEQIGKDEYTALLQPMTEQTNWQIPAVGFEAQSDNLTASSKPVLEKLGAFLLENSRLNVQIRCPEGSRQLGTKRAATVAAYLAEKGVSPTRMTLGFIGGSAARDTGIELYILP